MKSRRLQFDARENTASSRQHAPRPAMSPLPSRFDSLPGNLPETPPQLPCASPSVKTFDPPLGEPANEATGGATREKHHLLTVQEVAELLRVPVSWVYERTRRRSLDRLPGYRLGKYWRFNQNEVLAWVKRQCGAGHVA
jgi:excisionase family DNA binding protein